MQRPGGANPPLLCGASGLRPDSHSPRLAAPRSPEGCQKIAGGRSAAETPGNSDKRGCTPGGGASASAFRSRSRWLASLQAGPEPVEGMPRSFVSGSGGLRCAALLRWGLARSATKISSGYRMQENDRRPQKNLARTTSDVGYFLSGLRPDRTRCLRVESATGLRRFVRVNHSVWSRRMCIVARARSLPAVVREQFRISSSSLDLEREPLQNRNVSWDHERGLRGGNDCAG